MIGADTNLLVRFLLNDVPKQALRVKEVLESGETLYINGLVLAELYWVLVHVYEYSKTDFIRAMDALYETKGVRFFDSIAVRSALGDYIHTTAEFSDCLIHRMNAQKGLETLTFDRKASKLKGMKLLDSA